MYRSGFGLILCMAFICSSHNTSAQNSVQGSLRYDNLNHTPLAGIPVRLLNLAGLPVAFDTTNAQGQFHLQDYPSATYTFVAQIGYPWGGVNSTDALNAQRSFSGQQIFSPFRNRVADVNGNGVLNSTDAIQISRRVGFLTGSFAIGDFLWDPTLVVAQGSPLQRDFLVLCGGDINGSYLISPTAPQLSIDTVVALGYNTQVGLRFNQPGSGIFARGLCWSALPNPDVTDSVLYTGSGGFGFTAFLPGLLPGRNWYVKGFAQNSTGFYYSAEAVVNPTPVAPEMSTDSITQVTSNSIMAYGRVLRDGGLPLSIRGFCYDTSATPLITHGVVQASAIGPGNGIEAVISGLQSGRTYFVRSFGTNAAGTGYGIALSFYTPPTAPEVNTGSVSSLLPFSAQVDGQIPSDGGSPITSRGICWSSGRPPTIADDTTQNGTGIGSYTGKLSRLFPSTSYQTRAYAINSVGVAYGGVVLVNTPSAPFECGTPIIDLSGFSYPTIQIGGQCWTAMNLRVTSYRNGDPLVSGLDSTGWSTTQLGAWTINTSEPQFEANYGKLYNAHAAADTRGLCPTGWRVPTDPDWQALTQFLGLSGYGNLSMDFDGVGFALKSCRQLNGGGQSGCGTATHPRWNSHNIHYGSDPFGFAALPGGSLSSSGASFIAPGSNGSWWSSSSSGSSSWYVQLNSSGGNLSRTTGSRQNGRSIRCLRTPDTTVSIYMPPSIYTLPPAAITVQSAQISGRISSDGGALILNRGFCWNHRPMPTRNHAQISLGRDTGLFTHTLSTLSYGTYYVRAFAENAAGTAYGNSIQFTTLSPQGGNACSAATVTDVENNLYETVTIGSQCWMKTNLRTRRYNNNDTIASVLWRYQQNIPGVGTTTLYNNDTSNLSVYGRLYSYLAATDARGLCPTGWHLPSQSEWNALAQFAGDSLHGGLRLKAAVNWSGSIGGTDALGMSILPGGVGYNDNVFSFLGLQANFWACDLQFTDALGGNYRQVGFDRTPNQMSSTRLELHALSVRCIQNASTPSINVVLPYLLTSTINSITQNSAVGGGRILSDGGAPITSKGVCWNTARNPNISHANSAAGGGTAAFTASLSPLNPGTWYYVRAFATNAAGTAYGSERMFHTLPASVGFTCGTDSLQDLSGFRYATVLLGTQCWTKSHLRALLYTNGDSIPLITDSIQWKNTTAGAWSSYQNDMQYEQVYGKLYNWYAIADPRKLCPLGWHVPTNAELTTLINHTVSRGYPNTSSNVNGAGSALKSCRQVTSPLGGGCNTTVHPRWNSHTTHRGTDALGLSILPAGARSGDDGQFTSLSGYCLLLSSTLSTTNLVQGQYFRNSTGNISPATGTKPWGGSVRCIKD
ncbi:MAG: hypothetical protein FJ344_07080 [Sphingomonadales bacterium]|nr:hypothetical protein [Sphingomonadales bacterium]